MLYSKDYQFLKGYRCCLSTEAFGQSVPAVSVLSSIVQGVPLQSNACKISKHGLEPSGSGASSTALAVRRASWVEIDTWLKAAQAIGILVWPTQDVAQQSELLSSDEFGETREFRALEHFRV